MNDLFWACLEGSNSIILTAILITVARQEEVLERLATSKSVNFKLVGTLLLHHEHNIRLLSILPPSDVHSLTHCVNAQACFSRGWLMHAIFRSVSASLHSLLPLLLTSAPSITLLFCGGLFSPPKRPVHTGIIEDLRCTSASTCTHVCVLKIANGQRLDWQVSWMQNFKWLYVISPTRPHV